MKSIKKLRSIIAPRKGEREPDKLFMINIGIILIFGLVMLSSASAVISYTQYGNSYHFFLRQLMWVAVGSGILFFLSKLDYRILKRYAILFLFASIGLLLLVFVPGLSAEYGTSKSWIVVGGISLQPAEFVKLAFMIYLAAWLAGRKGKLEKLGEGIIPFLVILGIITLLMLAQPDLGTLVIIAISALMVYFIGGGRIVHLFTFSIISILLLALVVNFHSYQMDRIQCWLNPQTESGGNCYQINQSLIAVGSGGIFGQGLGQSKQKYMYLPEVSNDSIFPVIAEELGFIFSCLIILLYMSLFWLGIKIAKSAPDDFGKLLAMGIVSWIMIQAIVNIGGMINFIPMTGVPLPLISYGGSSIVATMAALGVVINISKQTK
jgi:cell division protein FtsW